MKGVVVDVGGGVHGGEDRAAEEQGGRRHQHCADQTAPGGAGYIPAHLGVVSRAELLGHRDGKAATQTHAAAHHQEVDGSGAADRRQRAAAQELAHDGGVHCAVELLEQQSKENGDAELKQELHRTSAGQVSCHGNHLAAKSRLL